MVSATSLQRAAKLDFAAFFFDIRVAEFLSHTAYNLKIMIFLAF
jgi:hypothetical protein